MIKAARKADAKAEPARAFADIFRALVHDKAAKKFPSRRHLPIVVSKGLKGSMKMKTLLVQELSADQYKKHLEGGIIGLLF